MTHLLQSHLWQNFQESLGRQVVSDSGDGWSYIAVLEKGRINSRLYAPYGPVVQSTEALTPALESLTAKAKQLGAVFIRVEPTGNVSASDLESFGLTRTYRVQPEMSSVVDLNWSEDEIISRMSPSTRNLHRNYPAKGLSFHKSADLENIEVMLEMLHAVAKHTGMHAHSDDYLRKQAKLFIESNHGAIYSMKLGDETVASALAYDWDGTRYYAHAAADYQHRKLAAGTSLVSEMIIDAKSNGLKAFDLYGIWPDNSPNPSHRGITRFKRSFGGDDVVYNGAWELPTRPALYALYRFLFWITGSRGRS